MSKPLPSLTPEQQVQVLSAFRSLRLSAHDKFLLELAASLARCPQPVSDLYVRIAVRQILGVVPLRDIVHREAEAC
jgi:hypothetical protein